MRHIRLEKNSMGIAMKSGRDVHAIRKRAAGFFIVDMMVGLGMALVLLMAMTVLVGRQYQGERRLSAAREAARRVEGAMLHLQNGEAVDAGIGVERLADAAPAGEAWVRVTTPGSGSGNNTVPEMRLVGLVPSRMAGGAK